MVTAYFARSCWISTRSSVRLLCVMSVDLTALHYKADVPCNGDVSQRIAGYGDDVGEVALGDGAEIGLVDQIGADGGGRAQHRRRRHTPIDKRDKFVGVLAVGD